MTRSRVVLGLGVLAGAIFGTRPEVAPVSVFGQPRSTETKQLAGDRVRPTGAASRGTAKGKEPAWVAGRRAWIAAREARHRARWNGTLPELVQALRREATLESVYLATLEATPSFTGAARGRATDQDVRDALLDALARGRTGVADRILNARGGPALERDPVFRALRAQAKARKGGPDSVRARIDWAPRRATGSAPAGDARGGATLLDNALPLVSGALADSAGDDHAARAAYWTLLASNPTPAARRLGRLRLAQNLLAEGSPRLALAVVAPEEDTGADAALLAASARAAAGDTTLAVERLVAYAGGRGVPTADRHAALTRAASWLRGSRADSLTAPTWSSLLRSLGEIGEATAALELLPRRRVAPRDSTALLERSETEAALLARARKNDAAAAVYGRLLTRPGRPPAERARYALGLARARRSAQNFDGADNAFRVAAELDPGGASGEVAAWERAREWEDDRSPREAARMFRWAVPRIRTAVTVEAARVHEAIGWLRAGFADSAAIALSSSSSSSGPGTDGALVTFWRGRVALVRADTVAARAAFAQTFRKAPWSYEGLRAAEELRRARVGASDSLARALDSLLAPLAPPVPRSGVAQNIGGDPPAARELEALGLGSLAREWLVECARGEAAAGVGPCLAALEDRGLFRRVAPREDRLVSRGEFPPAYTVEVVEAAAADTAVASLLWAVMRQESGYARAVRSRAGALGLLQLMPATAAQLAGRKVPEESLLVASVNVPLAARYLRNLTREMGDPRAVFAAYNAGEEAVRRWLSENGPVDDRWVELIPYRETRDYVKQVYAAWRRYEALYGTPAR